MNEDLVKAHMAYPDGWEAIETIMRMQAVKRWHMIETTRTQTLAEHCANCAALVFHMARKHPEFLGIAPTVAIYALFHDASESFLGDINPLTKNWLGSGLHDAERQVLPRELQFDPGIRSKVLIKLADLADGIRFIRLHGVDQTAVHAQKGIENRLADCFDLALDIYPEGVFRYVLPTIIFYAYEIGVEAPGVLTSATVRALVDHVARRSASESRRPRS